MPLPAGRLTLPLGASGLVRVRAAIETRDGGFRYVPLPGNQPGGRLLGFSFDVTGHGLEREAVTGEGAHPLGSLTLKLRPPRVNGRPLAVDFRAWKGSGLHARLTRDSARLRFLATSDLQPAFRIRQPLDQEAVPVVVSPAIAAAAGPGRTLPLQIEGTPVLTRVVGTANRFPSVDGDFVVADRQTLATAMNADHPGTAVTNEIWLGKPPPARPPFDVLRVITRQSVQEGLAGDPLARGSLLALVVDRARGALGLALAGAAPRRRRRPPRRARRAASTSRRRASTPAALRRHLRLRALVLVGLGSSAGSSTGAVLGALVGLAGRGDGERDAHRSRRSSSRLDWRVRRSRAARVRRRRRRPRRRCDLARLPQRRGRTLRGGRLVTAVDRSDVFRVYRRRRATRPRCRGCR